MVRCFRFWVLFVSLFLLQGLIFAQDYTSLLDSIWAETAQSAYYNKQQSEKMISLNNNLLTIIGQINSILEEMDNGGGSSSSTDYSSALAQMLVDLSEIKDYLSICAGFPDYYRYTIEPILLRIDTDLDTLSSMLEKLELIRFMAEVQNLNLIKIRDSLKLLEGALSKLDEIKSTLSTLAYDISAIKESNEEIAVSSNVIKDNTISIKDNTSEIKVDTDSIDKGIKDLLEIVSKFGGGGTDTDEDDLLTNYRYSQGVSEQVTSVEQLKEEIKKSIEEDSIYNTVSSSSSVSASSNPVLGNPDSEDSWSGSNVSNVTITNVDDVVNRYGEVEESSSSSTTDSQEFYVDLNKTGVNDEFDMKVLDLLDMADSKQKIASSFSSVTGDFEFWDLGGGSSSQDTSSYLEMKGREMLDMVKSGIDVGDGTIQPPGRGGSSTAVWETDGFNIVDFNEVDSTVGYFLEDNPHLDFIRSSIMPILYAILGGFACIKIFVWGLK